MMSPNTLAEVADGVKPDSSASLGRTDDEVTVEEGVKPTFYTFTRQV